MKDVIPNNPKKNQWKPWQKATVGAALGTAAVAKGVQAYQNFTKESEIRDYFRAVRKSNVNQIVNNQATSLQNPSRENFQKHLRTVVNGVGSYKERLAGQKDLTKKFKETDDIIAARTKTAFLQGFLKEAQATGLSSSDIVALLKYAEGMQIPGLGTSNAGAMPPNMGIQGFTNSAPSPQQGPTIPPAGGMPQQAAGGAGMLPMPPKQMMLTPPAVAPMLV
jgi:hypothetical protein